MDINGINAKATTTSTTDSSKTTTNEGTVGQQEFLMLLINQLQNQDPMNPMDSEQFAVQLAQFSQLEQLIKINQTLEAQSNNSGSTSTDSVGMMASFLGQRVVLKEGGVDVANGKATELMVEVPEGSAAVRVDILSSSGTVVASQTVETDGSGSQIISLEGLNVSDGRYGVKATAVTEYGSYKEVSAYPTGVVEGFILEPEPALLVYGQQVTLSDISKVLNEK